MKYLYIFIALILLVALIPVVVSADDTIIDDIYHAIFGNGDTSVDKETDAGIGTPTETQLQDDGGAIQDDGGAIANGASKTLTRTVVYEGATPIKDQIDTKIAEAVSVKEGKTVTKEELTKEQIASVSVDTVSDVGLAAKSVMEPQKYPYEIPQPEEKVSDSVTIIEIQKCRFDDKTQTMWYWISATRDGKEVAVDNPIWVYPAPKDIVISSVKDDTKNEITITKKEDPKLAIEAMLQIYVDGKPIGQATVGTKE